MTKQVYYCGDRRFGGRTTESVPPLGSEVTIDVAYTGICGTDLHVFHGDMDERVGTEAVLGHEMCGVVSAVGGDVTGVRIGDRVTVIPLEWCGRCRACLDGYWYICQNLRFRGLDLPGSMQSQWTVPAEIVVPLPDGISLAAGALVEPIAVAVHDVTRAEVSAGDRVLVVGGGPIGILIALVARHIGADVRLLEVDGFRRAFAAGYELLSLDPNTDDVGSHMLEWCDGSGPDVSFEVSGSEAGLASALQYLKVRGRLCLVGVHTQAPRLDAHRVFWRELSLVGARLYTRVDFERATELLATDAFDVEPLITHSLPLDSLSEAFQLLDSRANAMKVLLKCDLQPSTVGSGKANE